MRQGLLKILTTDDIEEIICTARELCDNSVRPTSQNILSHLINESKCHPSIVERFPFVLACAELAVGQPLADSRDKNNTNIRSLVAFQLHMEGYSYTDIGRMMKRDHSTVIHLVRKMEDMLSLPQAYKQEINMYNKMHELL